MKLTIKLLLLILTIFIIVFGFLFYEFVSIPGKVQYELERKQCNGVIDSIEKVQPGFMTIHIKELTETIGIDVMNCDRTESDSLFAYVKVGDSLIKERNRLFIKIIKRNGEHKEFPYPLCFR